MILDRLLAAQAEYGDPLISDDEIQQINAIWAEEISKPAKQPGDVT